MVVRQRGPVDEIDRVVHLSDRRWVARHLVGVCFSETSRQQLRFLGRGSDDIVSVAQRWAVFGRLPQCLRNFPERVSIVMQRPKRVLKPVKGCLGSDHSVVYGWSIC